MAPMTRAADIAALTRQMIPHIIELRRAIHMKPELGWFEVETTERVAAALEQFGVTPQVRESGLGAIADVGRGDNAVGFRADLDALPIRELNEVPYKSTVDGVMHACGHDVHTAIGVGIAAVLTQLGDIGGRVRFVFQPAEEKIPGGATELRAERVHEGLRCIIGFHVDPTLEPGKVGLRIGGITGASDRFRIHLSGPGGHTSRPHQTVDLVYVAGRVITDLPEAIRQTIDPREPLALVFGSMAGGSAENVIPADVMIGGTARMFDHDLWRDMPKLIEKAVGDLVHPSGARFELDYYRGSPPTVNDEHVIHTVRAAVTDALGPDADVATHQSLGSEDFAWYLEDIPGALIRLGSGIRGRTVDLHSATFDIDEAAIETGVIAGVASLLALLAS
jgi:amidohydrolase